MNYDENQELDVLQNVLNELTEVKEDYNSKSNELLKNIFFNLEFVLKGDISSLKPFYQDISQLENLLDGVVNQTDVVERMNNLIKTILTEISRYLNDKDVKRLTEIKKCVDSLSQLNNQLVENGVDFDVNKVNAEQDDVIIEDIMISGLIDEAIEKEVSKIVASLSDFDFSKLDNVYYDLYKGLGTNNKKEISAARGRVIEALQRNSSKIKNKYEEIKCLEEIYKVIDSQGDVQSKQAQIQKLLEEPENIKYKIYFGSTLKDSFSEFKRKLDYLSEKIQYKRIMLYKDALSEELKKHKEDLGMQYQTEFLDKRMDITNLSKGLPTGMGLAIQDFVNSASELKEAQTNRKRLVKLGETAGKLGKVVATPAIYVAKAATDNWYSLYLLTKGFVNKKDNEQKNDEEEKDDKDTVVDTESQAGWGADNQGYSTQGFGSERKLPEEKTEPQVGWGTDNQGYSTQGFGSERKLPEEKTEPQVGWGTDNQGYSTQGFGSERKLPEEKTEPQVGWGTDNQGYSTQGFGSERKLPEEKTEPQVGWGTDNQGYSTQGFGSERKLPEEKTEPQVGWGTDNQGYSTQGFGSERKLPEEKTEPQVGWGTDNQGYSTQGFGSERKLPEEKSDIVNTDTVTLDDENIQSALIDMRDEYWNSMGMTIPEPITVGKYTIEFNNESYRITNNEDHSTHVAFNIDEVLEIIEDYGNSLLNDYQTNPDENHNKSNVEDMVDDFSIDPETDPDINPTYWILYLITKSLAGESGYIVSPYTGKWMKMSEIFKDWASLDGKHVLSDK